MSVGQFVKCLIFDLFSLSFASLALTGMPEGAWTIKVGLDDTKAGSKARSVEQIRNILTQFSQS